MVFVLIFAILIVIREGFNFTVAFTQKNGKYNPDKRRLILLAIAISYIFTIIFTGFKLL